MDKAVAALGGKEHHVVLRRRATLESFYPIPELSEHVSASV